MTVYLKIYVNHLASSAQTPTNMSSMWNLPTPYLLKFRELTFWHEKRFFRKWADWGIWKNVPRLTPSLFPRVFFVVAVVVVVFFFTHCSLVFSARRHQWPRAWHGLIQEPGYGLLTNIRTSFALAPAVTFAFTFRLYRWASFGSKLFKIHATILTLRNETIVSIRESKAVSLEKII